MDDRCVGVRMLPAWVSDLSPCRKEEELCYADIGDVEERMI